MFWLGMRLIADIRWLYHLRKTILHQIQQGRLLVIWHLDFRLLHGSSEEWVLRPVRCFRNKR
jgi:hypothetical protein